MNTKYLVTKMKLQISKLNAQIQQELKRPKPSATTLRQLKKSRLHHKDWILRISARLDRSKSSSKAELA